MDIETGEPVTGTFEQGELVVVELSITPIDSLQNVVIADLLPAGLEIENARLSARAKLGKVQLPNNVTPLKPEHVDIRDDRLLIVTHLPEATPFMHRYLARAVTCGSFVLPAVRAECMYAPDIASTHGAGRIEVTNR